MRTLADATERVRNRSIAVALSGGGFRASLFSLGALLYLVDSGENRRVTRISSASGSSILNGLVLRAGDFSKMQVEDIDRVALRLLRVVLDRGLIWSSRVARALIGVVGLAFAFFLLDLVAGWPVGLNRWQMFLLLSAVFFVALFRGVLLTRLISRSFFDGRPSPLRSFDTTLTHTFCAADLNSAEPVFIHAGATQALDSEFGWGSVSKISLEDAIRASAAFPGAFPPKRIRLRDVGLKWSKRTQRVNPRLQTIAEREPGDSFRGTRWTEEYPRRKDPLELMSQSRRRLTAKLGTILISLKAKLARDGAIYLADGGVWNNLATTESPDRLPDADPELMLVVDASAPLTTQPLRRLAVPFVSEAGTVARSMTVLYNNTVEPRVEKLELQAALVLAGQDDAFPVVVRMTDSRSEVLKRLVKAASTAGVMPEDAEADWALTESRKELCGIWDWAAQYLIDEHAYWAMGAHSYKVPTTFNSIHSSDAIGLIIHGYLTTMMSMAFADGSPADRLKMGRFERLILLRTGYEPAFDRRESRWSHWPEPL